VVQALLAAGLEIHCLRDLTRGGLATALIELAEGSRLAIGVEESAIPVTDVVRGACEILGLEPVYVANEGRFICIVPEAAAAAALAILTAHALDTAPACIGRVQAGPAGVASLRSVIGAERVLDRLSGEQLPRIC
jgi:hydrogenase expression/formation protein HypE